MSQREMNEKTSVTELKGRDLKKEVEINFKEKFKKKQVNEIKFVI